MRHCYINHSSTLFSWCVMFFSFMLCCRESINSTQGFDQKTILSKNEVILCQFYCLCDSFFSSIHNLFLIYRTVTLLIFLFLLLISKEKSLTVSLYTRLFPAAASGPIGSPEGWGWQVSSAPSSPGGVGGLHSSCWSTHCQKGLVWGWTRHTVGTCPPWCASKSWYDIRLWAVSVPCSSAGGGCVLGSFEPFLSYLVCIFWISWTSILGTWTIGLGFWCRWFIQRLLQSVQSF